MEEKNINKKENLNYSTYETVGNISSNFNKKHFNFSKTIFIPFICGVLGATTVLGICIGVPGIKSKLIQTLSSDPVSTISSNNSANLSNTNLINLSNYSETGIAVAQKVRPSIVGITVEYSITSSFYKNGSGTVSAEGSGIIISEDGYILTNNHIVNSNSSSTYYEIGKANKVSIYLYDDETAYEGAIIGTDEQTDLAVIKIDKTGLIAAELGDSDNVKVGEFAMAIGNPLGMESSVSCGVISATNRKVTTDGKTYYLIQTDAAINSGNSGGALVNSQGQIIGINNLKITGAGVEGMGFSIPINSTKEIYNQLIQYQKVKRPYVGINGIDLNESIAKANNLVIGIYVKSIEDFSAAEKGGIKSGDVIIEADGKKIATMEEFNTVKDSHNIGDEMKIKINRNGSEKELTIILQEK